jgi:hypothetical protein
MFHTPGRGADAAAERMIVSDQQPPRLPDDEPTVSAWDAAARPPAREEGFPPPHPAPPSPWAPEAGDAQASWPAGGPGTPAPQPTGGTWPPTRPDAGPQYWAGPQHGPDQPYGSGPWSAARQPAAGPWNAAAPPAPAEWPAPPVPASGPSQPWQAAPGYQQPGWPGGGQQYGPGGGPPYGPGGAGPGGAGPGGSGKRVKPAFVIVPLAAVAAVAVGLVIAFTLGGDEGGTGQAFRPAGSSQTAGSPTAAPLAPSPAAASPAAPAVPANPGAAPGAAPNCTPVNPVGGAAPAGGERVLDIGQTAVVKGQKYSDYEARVTLNSVCTQSAAFNDWSKPSTHGTFVLANVTVQVVRGDVSASYFDFAVQAADGSKYDGDFPPVEPRLAAFDLHAGQTGRGYVLVDAPNGHNLLRWEPIFAANGAVWRY